MTKKHLFFPLMLNLLCSVFVAAQPIADKSFFSEGSRAVPVLTPVVPNCNRNQIVNNYLTEFANSSSSAEVAWTGSVATCNPGDISALTRTKMLARVNYYRKLVGLKPVTFAANLNATSQAGALMISANNQLNHTPPTTWTCYSQAGYDGSRYANIGLWSGIKDYLKFGDLHIQDPGTSNERVGHRRWILYSKANVFGCGLSDKGHSMYVIGNEVERDTYPEFIAYPTPGYFIKKLTNETPAFNAVSRWSFGLPSVKWKYANFDNTTVEMYDENNTAVTLKLNTVFPKSTDNSYVGDNTIVWEPTLTTVPNEDKIYKVKIKNVIVDGVTRNYEYMVALIDPVVQNIVKQSTKPTCGKANGSASITYAPGYKQLTWSNGAQNVNTISNLSTGKYYVSITDKLGCMMVDSIDLQEEKPSAKTAFVTKAATCKTANGEITLNSANNVNFAQFTWSNGATTSKITTLSAGTYNVTATDVNGCISTDSISIDAKPVATITLSSTAATCDKSNGVVTLSSDNKSNIKSYLWSNAATTQNIENLAAGAYKVTATDENECKLVDSVQINATPIGKFSLNPTPTSCGANDGAIAFVLQQGIFSAYNWSNGATTKDLVNLPAGTYSITGTDNNGCKIIMQAQVIGRTKPTVSLGADISITIGKTATLDATTPNASKYLWSNGATTAKIVVSQAGTYAVTVTNSDGCTATDEIKVTTTTSSLDVIDGSNLVDLYPNPVEQILYIQTSQLVEKTFVYGITGQLLYANDTPFEHKTNINIGHLAKGEYLLHLQTKDGIIVRRFTKL